MNDNSNDRASLQEVQEFCNKVRIAGGANPLDALLPAVPQDSSACLIARNLNFSCEVDGHYGGLWKMSVDDDKVLKKIAEATGCKLIYNDWDEPYAIELPKRIGRVAEAFDEWMDSPDPDSEFAPLVENAEHYYGQEGVI